MTPTRWSAKVDIGAVIIWSWFCGVSFLDALVTKSPLRAIECVLGAAMTVRHGVRLHRWVERQLPEWKP